MLKHYRHNARSAENFTAQYEFILLSVLISRFLARTLLTGCCLEKFSLYSNRCRSTAVHYFCTKMLSILGFMELLFEQGLY